MGNKRLLGAGGAAVVPVGLGCMGMSEFYGPSDEAESLATLRGAYDAGVDFFDTADMYGMGHNETLIGRFLAEVKPKNIVVATKFGIVREPGQYARRIDTSPAYLAQACEASLKRLGVDCLDLYYAHRINPDVPIEDTVGAMAALVQAGKVKALGLSEVSAATLRRAHAVHPIAAVQSEYSLVTRDPEAEVLPTCRELGVAFVAYSPLGRGLLSGTPPQPDSLAETDFRRLSPRFQGENWAANLSLADRLAGLAQAKGATPAQLALAWVLAQGQELFVIPGARKLARARENLAALAVMLTAEDLAALDAAAPVGAAAGDRYPAEGMKGLNA